jgi:hypothetical protein
VQPAEVRPVLAFSLRCRQIADHKAVEKATTSR